MYVRLFVSAQFFFAIVFIVIGSFISKQNNRTLCFHYPQLLDRFQRQQQLIVWAYGIQTLFYMFTICICAMSHIPMINAHTLIQPILPIPNAWLKMGYMNIGTIENICKYMNSVNKIRFLLTIPLFPNFCWMPKHWPLHKVIWSINDWSLWNAFYEICVIWSLQYEQFSFHAFNINNNKIYFCYHHIFYLTA